MSFVAPMLASVYEESFDNADWIFKPQYDGNRNVAVLGTEVHLYSRNYFSFESKFKAIGDELKKINHVEVFDGEIVVED